MESLAIILQKPSSAEQLELSEKTIAAQPGSTMEIWLKTHAPHDTKTVAMDTNPQAIEALKAGHVDGVMIDASQAIAFTRKNPQLYYKVIAQADQGYGITFKKGADLKNDVNKSLNRLEKKGIIKQLKEKYLGETNAGSDW